MSILEDKERLKEIFGRLANECVVMITGQSGAGKDTLVDSLKGLTPYQAQTKCLISTGDQFRKKKESASPSIRRILQAKNDAGERQNGLVAAMLVVMETMDYWDEKGVTIITGSPRSPEEVEYLYEFFWKFLHRRIILVNIRISDELATERIMHRNEEDRKAGRPVRTDTNTLEKIAAKVAFYHRDVVPAVEFMRGYDPHEVTVIEVNVIEGMSPEDVLEAVLKGISFVELVARA